MEHMIPLDAGFWQLEDGTVALHIGVVAVFAGPAPDLKAIRRRYARMVAATPRHRQRMHSLRLDRCSSPCRCRSNDPHERVALVRERTAALKNSASAIVSLRTLELSGLGGYQIEQLFLGA